MRRNHAATPNPSVTLGGSPKAAAVHHVKHVEEDRADPRRSPVPRRDSRVDADDGAEDDRAVGVAEDDVEQERGQHRRQHRDGIAPSDRKSGRSREQQHDCHDIEGIAFGLAAACEERAGHLDECDDGGQRKISPGLPAEGDAGRRSAANRVHRDSSHRRSSARGASAAPLSSRVTPPRASSGGRAARTAIAVRAVLPAPVHCRPPVFEVSTIARRRTLLATRALPHAAAPTARGR